MKRQPRSRTVEPNGHSTTTADSQAPAPPDSPAAPHEHAAHSRVLQGHGDQAELLASPLDALQAIQAQFLAAWFGQVASMQSYWLELARAMPVPLVPPLAWPGWTAAAAEGGDAAGANAYLFGMMETGRDVFATSMARWLNMFKPGHSDHFVA